MTFKKCLFALALALAAANQLPATPAGTAKAVNVQAGELTQALDAVARQYGINVIYVSRQVRGLRTAGVNGNLTPREAVEKLIQGMPLRVTLDDDTGAMMVVPAAPARSAAEGPADQMRLAAVEGDATGPQGGETRAASSERADVVVAGERDRPAPFSTANLDLTRTEDDALPFTVFTAQDIQLSGSASLQEFLQNRLPQNFNADIPYEMDGGASDSYVRLNRIDMRGWGPGETVILVNGRRLASEYPGLGGDSTDNATANLQAIPLASIERIEILSSAGSAIYGANATGGVINIITREDFRGGQLAVNYESPADVHAPVRGVNLSYGMPLNWGVGLRLTASYSERQPLRAGDRAPVTIERWRRLVMERQPTRLINQVGGNPLFTSSRVFGATPNIRAVSTTGNLFADLPGAPASSFTTIPDGYTGGDLSAFQPGVFNLDLAEGASGGSLFAKRSTLGATSEDTVVNIGLDRNFGEQWRWSVDYRYAENQSEGSMSTELSYQTGSIPGFGRVNVPAEAPGNPFGQPVRINFIDPSLDRPEVRHLPKTATWALTSTLRGAIGSWRGFVDVGYSQNRNTTFINSYWEPYGGWEQAFLTGAYNPFVDFRVMSPAPPEFYEHYIAQRYFVGSATRNYQSMLKASGPVFHLPAGTVQLTGGMEWSRADRHRSDRVAYYMDSQTGELVAPSGRDSPIASTFFSPPNNQFVFDAYAGYAEMTVPLLSALQDVPLVERLELFGSGRLEYSDFKGSRSGQYEAVRYTHRSHIHAWGLQYEPLEGFTLRASQSIGFKPPAFYTVTPGNPPTGTTTGLTDPIRDEGLALTPSMYVTGGNPDLRPETTRSINIGLIFASPVVPGLRMSLDYLESTRDDAIFSLSAQEAINLEQELPGVVLRGAPDGHASGAGPITFVDRRYINLRQIASRSVDLSLEQQLTELAGGRLVMNVAATRNLSFKVQASNTGPAVEQIRNTSGAFSQQIAWSGNAQLRWEGLQWGLGWSARYFDYVLAAPSYQLLQGADRAPAVFNHDLNVSYRTEDARNTRGAQGLLSGLSVNFGVKNVFDRTPRFWAASFDMGVAPYDSIMGRSVWLQLRKDFAP